MEKNWDAIFGALAKYIDDNLEIEMPGFNVLSSGPEGRLDSFIDKTRGKSVEDEKTFASVLESIVKDIGAEPPDIYKPAKITRDYWSKLFGPDRPHPGKLYVVALGLSIIQVNTKKKNPLNLNPEQLMDKLLLSAGGEDYRLKSKSIFDLIIKFCLEEAEKIYDVDEANKLLAYKDLPLLPDGKKKEKE